MPNAHLYFFHGSDSYSIAEKVALWKAEFDKKHGGENCTAVDCETLGKECDAGTLLSQLLHTATLFSTTKLVIVKNLFAKNVPKHLLDAFAEEIESVPPTHFLVFCDERFDSRTSFAKKIKSLSEAGSAKILEFAVPRGRDLAAWVRQYLRTRQAQMETSAISEFVNRFDSPTALEREKWQKEKPKLDWDLWAVRNELEKLIAYAQGRAIVSDDVRLLARENADAHVFTLIDALCLKQKKQARRLATLIVGDGPDAKSSAIGMFALLASQFLPFLIIKESSDRDSSLAQKLGWSPQRLWVVSKKIQSLSLDQLKNAYRALLDADAALKSSSLDPLVHFERVLATI